MRFYYEYTKVGKILQMANKYTFIQPILNQKTNYSDEFAPNSRVPICIFCGITISEAAIVALNKHVYY